ncbi:DUF3237 domain-containing protein [Marinibaculum pumilum]|uniref:UPF0311 protein ACFOGJ_15305 n=1 Tax=Marinibaculum pumilum TaxID=1766165 RepID=A0ABV7L1T3_9PROT
MSMTVQTRHLFTLEAKVSIQMGQETPTGMRRIAVVEGGSFRGERLRGEILPTAGGDWLLGRPDGVLLMDVRLTLKTDDGAFIYMTYTGMRHGPEDVIRRLNAGEPVDPSEYYFRVTPRFETASGPYDWLNRLLAVGIGDRKPHGPVYEVFEIL